MARGGTATISGAGAPSSVVRSASSSSLGGGATTVVWFRKCLRLHDNAALLKAVGALEKQAAGADAGARVAHTVPLFVLDPWFTRPERVGATRMRFLLEALADLDSALKQHRSRLVVLHGKAEEVVPAVVERWGATMLCFEADAAEPFAAKRDAAVRRACEGRGVEVHALPGHTLYDTRQLLALNGGKAPLTYQSFVKLVKDKAGPVPPPVPDPPENMPPPPSDAETSAGFPLGIPTLPELGYDEPSASAGSTLMPGGESAGLQRLAVHTGRVQWVAQFDKPKTNPTKRFAALPAGPPSLLVPDTTALSPYLKFGCVSARRFHAELMLAHKKANGKVGQPPTSLEGQLLWREFFYTVGAATPNFDRMEGNPICKQVPWGDDAELLRAWEEGRTGYPWIDACMTQLRTQGWLHHLARHAVACFLTRGDLWQSWEKGAAVFERYLVDADWCLNNANWMWLSASAFFSQYFRVYGPVSFGKKYDPDGSYVRHFLPQLKKMPKEYIYEPWKAPLSVQKAAGCIIGEHYPAPVVDHDVIHKENISMMAAAYKAAKEDKPPSPKRRRKA